MYVKHIAVGNYTCPDECQHIDTKMANGGLLRPVMSPGLKSQPWSTH